MYYIHKELSLQKNIYKMEIFNFSSLLFETDFLVLLSMKRGSWTNAGVTNVEVNKLRSDKRRSDKRQSGQTQEWQTSKWTNTKGVSKIIKLVKYFYKG